MRAVAAGSSSRQTLIMGMRSGLGHPPDICVGMVKLDRVLDFFHAPMRKVDHHQQFALSDR
ncbi:hypothetical protein P5W98_34910 (plasmid) [Paraburkholderia sp. A1BS-2L]|uniref:hypothetical protein n=1 Tax=unclassified Paraburkholderia TaxID=2615204 RepID=UPI003DA9CF68